MAAFLAGWAVAHAQAPAPVLNEGQKSLRGLHAVRVVIEDIPALVERAGLTGEELHRGVEARLRRAGLKAVEGERWLATPGRPWLHVVAYVLPDTVAAPPLTYSCQLALYQRSSLVRDPKTAVSAATWVNSNLGSDGTMENVRDNVKKLVDQFLADWKAANGKK